MNIHFDNTDFQLGNLKYGETKLTIVTVTNTSGQDMVLETANSSCSCTSGSLKQTRLAGAGKTQFVISLNTVKAGKGMNQVKTIQLKYTVGGVVAVQIFRLKANII